MNCIYNNTEYLERKLSGEDVISAATLYGMMASESMSESFIVIVLNETDYSFYNYGVSEKRFFVTDFKESIAHDLAGIIPLSVVSNHKSYRWWEHVYFERNGLCTYDNYYDSLRINEDDGMTFREANEKLRSAISQLELPPISSDVYLAGNLVSPIMRYNLQEIISAPPVYALPLGQTPEIINENDVVSYSSEKLNQFTLNANGGLMLSLLAHSPVVVTLPILSCQSEMLSGIKWEDMLVDRQKDYTVGNYDYKVLSLKVECDPFQNAFLSCQDYRGNRVVKQII